MKRILPCLAVSLLLAGCTNPGFHAASALAAAGGGAAAGSLLTRGHPGGAAAGAALLVGANEAVHHFQTRAEQKAYQKGYESALANQAKRDYWQRQQQQQRAQTSPVIVFPVPLSERVTPDGVRLQPSIDYIEIHQ